MSAISHPLCLRQMKSRADKATGWTMERNAFRFPVYSFIFSETFRPALEPTHLLRSDNRGLFSRLLSDFGTRLNIYLHLAPSLRMSGALTLLPLTHSWRGEGRLYISVFDIIFQSTFTCIYMSCVYLQYFGSFSFESRLENWRKLGMTIMRWLEN